LNFSEIQKQEQEQERRAREAALAAQQLVSNTLNLRFIDVVFSLFLGQI